MTYLAALFSGLLLFASDHPVHWWWLQFVALVPFWWALLEQRSQQRRLWPIGLLAAASNALPLLMAAGIAPPILAAAAVMLLQWPLVAMLAGRVLSRGPLAGPLAAAAVITLAEVLVWYAVPIFGTAQCFVRPLSAAPACVGFIAFTGVGGLVFVLAATQVLLASAIRNSPRQLPLAACVVIVVVAAALDVVRWQRSIGTPIRVAAHGWHEFPATAKTATQLYQKTFATAGEAKARLLVTPEAAVDVGMEGYWFGLREEATAMLGAAANNHDLFAIIGVFLNRTNDNRIWFVDPNGTLVGEYKKSHLIPFLENYTAGDGTLVTADFDGISLGGMICQDDNFTDLGRDYGSRGVQLVAVPTNDWPSIREFHLENGIFRAIENGYAVVRATSHGISALITPRGEVMMRHDHVTDGERILIGDLPTGDGEPTIYARLGDWPIVGLCALLALIAMTRRPTAVTGV